MLEGHSETTSHKPTTKQTHGRKGELREPRIHSSTHTETNNTYPRTTSGGQRNNSGASGAEERRAKVETRQATITNTHEQKQTERDTPQIEEMKQGRHNTTQQHKTQTTSREMSRNKDNEDRQNTRQEEATQRERSEENSKPHKQTIHRDQHNHITRSRTHD